jgi:flagellar biosynthetic protein FlhB
LLVPIAVVVATVLLFEILQTGVVFSTEPLKPDFSRLNPATGLQRLFTMRMLIETGKNILKLCLYASVGYLVIRRALRADIGSIAGGAGLLAAMASAGLRLLAAFIGVAAFFAIVDQLIVRKDFLKKMRMSKQELRQETREREGDPRIKQKRKKLHVELAKMHESMRNLRGADVLITNPQHIALALRYDRRTMPAPLIVSIGTNRFAQKLKRMAFIHGVPIVENRPLAQELFRKSALNLPIPEHCFRPVADIYKRLRRTSGRPGTER